MSEEHKPNPRIRGVSLMVAIIAGIAAAAFGTTTYILLLPHELRPAQAAPASGIITTHSANTCAVDDASRNKYDTGGNKVQFLGANTGSIILRCNVTNPSDTGKDPDWSELAVTYRDPDGSGTAYNVQAKLYNINLNNGVGSSPMASFSSSVDGGFPSPPPANGVQVGHVCFGSGSTHFNFAQYAYYIELTISRTSTAANPTVFATWMAQCSDIP